MVKRNSNIQDVLYRKEAIDAVNDNIRNISLVLLALAVVLTFYLLCFDKQYDKACYILQALPHPYNETGGGRSWASFGDRFSEGMCGVACWLP